jgi:hypothetical protein
MIDLSKLSQNMWETTPAKKKNPWDAPTTSGVGLNTAGFGPQMQQAAPQQTPVSGGGFSLDTSGFGPQMTQKTGGWETPTFPGLGSAGDTKTTTGGNGTGGYNPGQSGTLGTGASAPGWLGGGAYAKWGTQDPDYDPNDPAVAQDWWRSPSLNPQGGLVYNDKYGWQDRSQVKDMYKQGTAFDQFGFTPQLDQDWNKYYAYDEPTIQELPPWGSPNPMPGEPPPSSPPNPGDEGGNWNTGGEMGNPDGTWNEDGTWGMQPNEWNTASNVLQGYAQGQGGVNAPTEWNQASNNATNMARTGNATSASDAYMKAKQVAQADTTDAIKQAAEQAGLGGTRWSSSMGRNAQDIAGRRMAELGSNFAQQEMGAQEAARGRQMEANNQLFGIGSGFAGLDTDTRNRALQATGQLSGLGQNMTRYPMELANQAAGMGGQLQGINQGALNNTYQDFLRGATENNPWLAKAMGMATNQGQQAQYLPGAGSQILNSAGGGLISLLPFLFG